MKNGHARAFVLSPAKTHSHQAWLAVQRKINTGKSSIWRKIVFVPQNSQILAALAASNHPDDVAIIAVENSCGGLVTASVSSLLKLAENKNHELHVGGGYWHKIRHHLIAPPKAKIKKVKVVYSHEQALAQCGRFIAQNGWETFSTSSTAAAVEQVLKNGDPHIAAIGGLLEEDGDLFVPKNGRVLRLDIQDNTNNQTYFHLITRHNGVAPGAQNRTAMFIWQRDQVAALNKITHIIGVEFGVNLRCIHSIPLGKQSEYAFYIEVAGHTSDSKLQKMIKRLEKHCLRVEVIGSFPVYSAHD